VLPACGLWFSSSLGSRKIRNLRANPECVATVENAADPVILEGTAEVVTDLDRIAEFLAGSNAKYEVDYGIDFLDPVVNATVRIAPRRAFALRQDDFTGSPTRWAFPPPPASKAPAPRA
jgi:Pyridoxamine 5'-phosphate oxidase